jgi:GMP synthase (glutamine-hydrolysing)
MAIIVFQHGPIGGPGRLGLTLRDHGFKLDIRRLDLPEGEGGSGSGVNRHIPPDFDDVEGVIALGGPQNVTDDPPPPWMEAEMAYLREAHKRQLPVLGICLGAQMIAQALGGKVGPGTPEWGFHKVQVPPPAQVETIMSGIAWDHWMFQAHNQAVLELPSGALNLASSPACKVEAFKVGLRTYGFQYHFECDGPAIELQMRESPGGVPAGFAEQMTACYPEFARLADRLCVNIASYVFPLQRKRIA